MNAEELAGLRERLGMIPDWSLSDANRTTVDLLAHIARLDAEVERLREVLRDISADDKRGIPGALARQALLAQEIVSTPRKLPDGKAAALRMVADMTGDEADAQRALDAAMEEEGL